MNMTRFENQISLNSVSSGIKKFKIKLGWNIENITDVENFEIDPIIFLLGKNTTGDYKLLSENHFVFYNNLTDSSNTVNLDIEQKSINIDMNNINDECSRILFSISIFDAINRNQNFVLVKNIYIRLLNTDIDTEIFRYDLPENHGNAVLIDIAELILEDNDWIFKILSDGHEHNTDLHLLKYGFNSTYD